MPLLGRNKTTQSAQTATTSSQQQPLCQSPLFGLRRQLNLAAPQTRTSIHQASSRPATTTSTATTSQPANSVPRRISRQQLHYAFAIMDTNGDGMVDVRDLSQMLANLGVPIDEAILSHVMSSASRRGDHRISEAEFMDWIAKFIEITGANEPADRSKSGRTSSSQAQGSSSPAGRRSRSPRPFRLSGSRATLDAQSDPEVSAQASGRGGRRGSVGSGLALMRSLSGSNLASSSSAGSQATKGADDKASGSARHLAYSRSLGEHGTASSHPASDELEETRRDLKAAFCVFDLDGDGYITLDEVRAGLKLLGESWSVSEIRHFFGQTAAASASGGHRSDLSANRISIDDFVKLLL